MELRELEAFLAVADELHFGRAAARLHVTTTRVSQHVRALERRVGGTLFERTTRRVRLTALGERLRARLEPAYVELNAAVADARQSSRDAVTTLRVAFSTSMSRGISADLVGAFRQRHPHCTVLRSARPSWHLQSEGPPTLDGVDVFVTWAPGGDPEVLRVPGFEIGPALRSFPRTLFVGRRHPLAGRASVDVEELAGHDLLHPGSSATPSARAVRFEDAWTPPVTPGGLPLRRVRRLSANYLEELITIVAEGELAHLTVASLGEIYRQPDTVMLPLTGLPPMLVVPVWPATAANPLIAAFVEAAR